MSAGGTVPAFSGAQMPAIEASPTQPLTTEEQEQLQQTVEMFEVITQANPQDAQSMEILKEAYFKLGQRTEGLVVARRLAEAHMELGQFSGALLEYEFILQNDPENSEIIAALGQVEERLRASQAEAQTAAGGDANSINLDFRSVVVDGGNLMATKMTQSAERVSLRGSVDAAAIAKQLDASEDGNDSLAKFLGQHRLVTEDVLTPALMAVRKRNGARQSGQPAASLIAELVARGGLELENLLNGILDRSKFAYLPIEYYDVDRQIVKMLPESVTLGRLIVPFDIISRTMMVALANPFDSVGKEAVQQLLDYNIQWHLASPEAVSKVLVDSYRR
jgi:tetratricopeptide (TPR) repeat protein